MSTAPSTGSTHWRRPTNQPSQPDFLLNTAPVELEGSVIVAERLPYSDNEHLDALHTRTRDTHLVRRDDDSLFCIPYMMTPPSLGGQPVDLDFSKDLYLAAFLVRQALLAHLHALGRPILDFRPVTVLADRPEDDYLAMALPSGVANSGLLRVSPVYELDVRVLSPEGQDAFLALTLDVRVSRRILAPARISSMPELTFEESMSNAPLRFVIPGSNPILKPSAKLKQSMATCCI